MKKATQEQEATGTAEVIGTGVVTSMEEAVTGMEEEATGMVTDMEEAATGMVVVINTEVDRRVDMGHPAEVVLGEDSRPEAGMVEEAVHHQLTVLHRPTEEEVARHRLTVEEAAHHRLTVEEAAHHRPTVEEVADLEEAVLGALGVWVPG